MTLGLLTFVAMSLYAQTEQAGITGTVRDRQGAAISDAQVEVRHEETMEVRRTRTGYSGVFFIGALSIGTYSISITHPGFDPVEVKSTRLSVGQVQTVDATLQVRGRSEEVLVSTNISDIDRVSSGIGARIDQTQLKNLPLNGRNWASLLPLIPGAVDPGAADQRSVRFSGHGRDDNNFTLDGIDAGGISNQPQKAAIRLLIPTSAIQEFKVDSAVSATESAATTGGQVILASKAGTNTFHAEAFNFLRNDIFDARNPFALVKPPFRLNQYGATLLKPMNGVLNLTRVLSDTGLNETRIGFNQILSRTINRTSLPYSLAVAGFTTLSSSRTREEDDTSISFIDNISLARDRHLIKAGIEARRVFTNPGSSADGTLTYATRDNFLLNQLDSASVTAFLPLKRLRKTQIFPFVQDEYKATPNFTLTLGLRYQYFGVFSERDGRAIPFDFASCGGFCPAGSEFSAPRRNDIDPRLGVAWAPRTLRGKTVIRTGAGIYHGDGQLEDQNLPASNDVARYSLNSRQIAALAYPIDSFLSPASSTLSPRAQNRSRKDETSPEWGLTIQQELPAHFIGTISYSGNKGIHLQTITYQNVIDSITGLRPNPQYGQVEYRTNESTSSFHSLQISAHRYLNAGWMLAANYMWSHAINDGSLGGGEADAIAPQNVFCRKCERASSDQDIRHFFTTNSVYTLPFGNGRAHMSEPGMLETIFGGWSLSGIATARSGRPVNITIKRAAADAPNGYSLSASFNPP